MQTIVGEAPSNLTVELQNHWGKPSEFAIDRTPKESVFFVVIQYKLNRLKSRFNCQNHLAKTGTSGRTRTATPEGGGF